MTRFFSQVILERNGSGGADPRPRRLASRQYAARMRYLVTGAAGFIGSHLAEALAGRRARRRRDRLLHRLLRPGAQGGERPRPRHPDARSRRGRARLRAASTASSTSRASRASGASATSSRSTCAATCSPRSACSRRRRATGCGSSSLRLPRSTAPPSATRRRRSTTPQPLSPYGITKLACEHLAAAYAREFGLDCVVLRYFNAFGPRQRPDMAFTRIVNALAAGATFELYGDGDQSPQLDVRRRRRRRDDRRRWSAAPAPTTSAARSRRR